MAQTGLLKKTGRRGHSLYAVPFCMLICGFFVFTKNVLAKSSGETIFKTTCVACHTIGRGKLVGPDLVGVYERRKEEWIRKFIKSSQSLVQAGDPEAVALFNEFNKMPMPDHPFSETEIDDLLQYIKSQSGGKKTTGKEIVEEAVAVTTEEIAKGQALFQGVKRFKNNGPTCNSCHHVKNDAVIGGGILARELTTVFSRMSGIGVKAILGSPPFPVMEQAYKNNPLTEEEIQSLAAFLEEADKQHSFQKPRDYGMRLLTTGIGGALFLFGLLAFVMPIRKKKGVYDAIFERQKQEKQ